MPKSAMQKHGSTCIVNCSRCFILLARPTDVETTSTQTPQVGGCDKLLAQVDRTLNFDVLVAAALILGVLRRGSCDIPKP